MIHNHLVAFKFALLAVFGTYMSLWLGQAATQIGGDLLMDVKTVIAVGSVVLLGTWRLSKWMQEIVDRLKQQDDHRHQLELKISRLEGMLMRLPCVNSRDQNTQD